MDCLKQAGLFIGIALMQAAGPLAPNANAQPELVAEQNAVARIRLMDQLDIRFGELARDRAASPRIRRLGDWMARDFKLIDRLLLQYALDQKLNVRATLPRTYSERLRLRNSALNIDRLEHSAGLEFDHLFLAIAKADQDNAYLELREIRSELVRDSPLFRLLGTALPLLHEHHALATLLAGELNRGRSISGER